MPALVAGIHVSLIFWRPGWPGHRRAEATPSFGRRCPAMTNEIVPLRSLHQHVFPVLHRQQNARAVVETIAIGFGEVIDALARGDIALGQKRLAKRVAEFRRAR